MLPMSFRCYLPVTPSRTRTPRPNGNNQQLPPWLPTGTRLTGTALGYAGVQLPDLLPEQLLLLHARRI